MVPGASLVDTSMNRLRDNLTGSSDEYGLGGLNLRKQSGRLVPQFGAAKVNVEPLPLPGFLGDAGLRRQKDRTLGWSAPRGR